MSYSLINIKPYIIGSIGEEFAVNQITTKYKDVLGNIETSDGLSFLNYDTVTKMKGANDKSNEVIIPESETRFFSTIDAKANATRAVAATMLMRFCKTIMEMS